MAATKQADTIKYIMSNGFVDYYELLQVDDDATPATIKSAYRTLAKMCHPDILGEAEGHNICILLNEAYEVLTDPDKRAAYDVQLEQALEADEDDYTGEALSRWIANTKMGKNEEADENRAVFVVGGGGYVEVYGVVFICHCVHSFPYPVHVPSCLPTQKQDEATCIGCKQCVWCAPATFRIEPVHGRSRVFAQWIDNEDNLQSAIDACPVSCIHWVEREQLPALEYVMQNVVARENVGVMMAGQGRPVEDVFQATDRFLKQRERKYVIRHKGGEGMGHGCVVGCGSCDWSQHTSSLLHTHILCTHLYTTVITTNCPPQHREQKEALRQRYSKQQEAARRAAAQAVAEKQASWFNTAMGSLFGMSDVMRGNMGYGGPGDGKVGRRKRKGPVRYSNPNTGGTIPPERALVPVSVNAKRPHDYLEY